MSGVIAAGSPATAEAGAEILRAGGNAVDAAVAAAFASFVAEPASSTIGGGGFALVYDPNSQPQIYDFICVTPGQTTTDGLDFQGVDIPFGDMTDTYHVGRGSTAIPGNPAGLAALMRDATTLPPEVLAAPAIRYAREGVKIEPGHANAMKSLEYVLRYSPSSDTLYAPHGQLLQAGETYTNPAFANTLEQLVKQGVDSFYTGDIAAAIVDDHKKNGGLLTLDALAAYAVVKRPALRFDYRGNILYTNPPPSSGGILIAYALGLLAHADLDSFNYGEVDHIALLAEVMRQTNRVRREERPKTLVDPAAWAHWLRADRFREDWQRVQQALNDGPPAPILDGPGGPNSTTHISVIDGNGMAVGITTTPGATGGYAIGDTGLLMNNMLGEPDLNPDGFHRFQPLTRVLSMMAPTVVSAPDGRRLVVGSAGANRLRTAILQVIHHILDGGLSPDEAVSRARVHFEANLLDLEGGIDKQIGKTLVGRGYAVRPWRDQSLYFGGAHLAMRTADSNFTGAGDSRRSGAFVVVA